jgi:hypothetical protein
MSDSNRDKQIVKRLTEFVTDHRGRIKPEELAAVDAFIAEELLHCDVLFSYAVHGDEITGCTYSYRVGEAVTDRTVVDINVTNPAS